MIRATRDFAIPRVKTTSGQTIAKELWEKTFHNVLRPRKERQLNINHERILGCEGERSWTVEIDTSSATSEDELQFDLEFPSLSENNTILKTVTVPNYTVPPD